MKSASFLVAAGLAVVLAVPAAGLAQTPTTEKPNGAGDRNEARPHHRHHRQPQGHAGEGGAWSARSGPTAAPRPRPRRCRSPSGRPMSKNAYANVDPHANAMKFGLFGSAQAQRGGPDLDSGQGFRDYIEYNVEAEALGYDCDLRGRASFHRLRPGFGEPQSADLARGAHQDAAARHRRHGAALAQSGAAGRAGRDHRPSVRRPARFRRRQGLSPQRVRQLLHPAGGGRRAVRGEPRADHRNRGRRTSASRITASTGISRTSSSSRRPRRSRIRRSGWRPAARIRSARWRGAASSCCSTSSPRRSSRIERFNIYKAEVEACGRNSTRWTSASAAPSLWPRTPRTRRRRIEARLANQQRLARLSTDPTGKTKSSHADLRRDARRRRRKRDVRFAGRDRGQARDAALSRHHARPAQRPGRLAREPPRFRPDIMPAFAGERAAIRSKPELVNP